MYTLEKFTDYSLHGKNLTRLFVEFAKKYKLCL